MKSTITKLISIAILTVITLIIVVSVSYAWLSMSVSPEMSGLAVKIGGTNTILVAPDITAMVSGQEVHYPGKFTDTLNLSDNENYSYLNTAVSLAPTSTTDGIYWYFPSNEQESGYICDSTLEYANLQELPEDSAVQGGYACIDFWVVSPAYASLRVSAGEGNSGSYVVSLPQAVEDENGGYTLDMSTQLLSACTRVGFLANMQTVTDRSMNRYVNTAFYNDSYRSLKGVYQKKGEQSSGYPANFTIYEPNADLHSDEGAYALSHDGFSYVLCQRGAYAATKPISAKQTGLPEPTDVSGHTTVQKTTEWLMATDSQTQIEQMFGTYLYGVQAASDTDLTNGFYNGYLGYQCAPYLKKGEFIKSSANLSKITNADGIATDLSVLETAGATNDIVIAELEKNVPQRIRMYVWIEGQDIDCQSASAGGKLLINLELAASTN